jgi:predicted transposase YbfD/YdcC
MDMATPSLSLRKHFAKLKDPRVVGRTEHRLLDIIVMAVCAVIGGADDWAQVATFAEKRHDWFKRFLPLPGGIPAHDTFERLFDRLDPTTLQSCLLSWIQDTSETLGLRQVAIDGKTLRGSTNAKASHGALHLVSAWATANQLFLGQVAVDGKSNEITAIPRLLELLDLQGALVTIDAMGCQKEIAAQIVEASADYVLAVKDNQPRLLEDIQIILGKALDTDFAGLDCDHHHTKDRGHGRVENRHYTIINKPTGIRDQALWAKLCAIGICHSERTRQGVTSEETRYFILSRSLSAKRFGQAVRGHWGIENQLHWQLDVTFREDASRIQSLHGAENFSMLRRLALALLKQHPDKRSLRCKRLAAALDTRFLEETLRQSPKLEKI